LIILAVYLGCKHVCRGKHVCRVCACLSQKGFIQWWLSRLSCACCSWSW
jgi:hypothetical protein